MSTLRNNISAGVHRLRAVPHLSVQDCTEPVPVRSIVFMEWSMKHWRTDPKMGDHSKKLGMEGVPTIVCKVASIHTDVLML